jgi:DegV family protein with EDD domain
LGCTPDSFNHFKPDVAAEDPLIGIVTDSTCDIPEALINQYGIIVVPHTIIWGEEQYRDRVDLQPDEFYRRLESDPHCPTSSQATIAEFKQAYEKAASLGASELIVLTVSSAMSGAYNIAQQAAELVKFPVSVVDSKGPTMSLGWQVLAAARASEAGASLSSILNQLNQMRSQLVQLVSMNTLEYLQKGGRIGDAVKWMGMILGVKTLVSINHQSGRVEPLGLTRTQKAVIEMMYDKFFELLRGSKNLHVAVLHGNALGKAEELAERIRVEYNPIELLINITGPVLGINTGPNALALCGYFEE